MTDKEIITAISSYYPIQILKAYNNDLRSIKSVELIAKSLNDIYRYFEPSFFKGNFYVCKHFNDELILNETTSTILNYNKNILLNKTSGDIIIQIFNDGKLILWEKEDPISLIGRDDALTYFFNSNKEYFYANNVRIEITECPVGSRFATQYIELKDALSIYSVNRIFHSSCSHFSEVWYDANRIFLRGEGSGKNIPEKFIQKSLHEFLEIIYSLRGVSIEVLREFNVEGEKPKPVDIRIQWKEANRVALIEMKWLGTVKGSDGKIAYSHDDGRANAGMIQLKGYYDSALRDMPTTIIKPFLVVIDGRRKNLHETTTTISYADGMFYKDVDLIIDPDNKFYESIIGFEPPIRMFSAPNCI
ncbi:Uncharacterised protein [uncultured archaeon]|nr:Uncharacterised protein [uncultured archaeon]